MKKTTTKPTPAARQRGALPPLLAELPGSPTLHDSYCETITDETVIDADSAVRSFFTSARRWLDHLMRIRHAIVGRLGFNTGNRGRNELPKRFETGHKIGVFEVFDRRAGAGTGMDLFAPASWCLGCRPEKP